MSLLETIKADQLTARKDRDAVAAAVLTTLIGEASSVSEEEFKKGVTQITDEKVQATITKFVKNAKAAREFMEAEFVRVMGHGTDDSKTRPLSEEGRTFMEAIVPKMRATDREIALLSAYLPQQMSEAELQAAINLFKQGDPSANVGAVMGHLKANYAGLYDGKLASQLAKG